MPYQLATPVSEVPTRAGAIGAWTREVRWPQLESKIAENARSFKHAWIGPRNILVIIGAPETILRIYVFLQKQGRAGKGHTFTAAFNMHFFLDIQFNPPYKGDTSAFSK